MCHDAPCGKGTARVYNAIGAGASRRSVSYLRLGAGNAAGGVHAATSTESSEPGVDAADRSVRLPASGRAMRPAFPIGRRKPSPSSNPASRPSRNLRDASRIAHESSCSSGSTRRSVPANGRPSWVRLAGDTETVGRGAEPSRTVAWSEIVAADPEIIIVACCGFNAARTRQDLPTLAGYPGFDELTCVRSGQVYLMDGNAYFSRPGPRLVDSLEILAHTLHRTGRSAPTRPAPARQALLHTLRTSLVFATYNHRLPSRAY
jgi:hypothetical protein